MYTTKIKIMSASKLSVVFLLKKEKEKKKEKKKKRGCPPDRSLEW